MEKEEFSPYASFLEFSEEIYLMLGSLYTLIVAGIGIVILTIIAVIDFFFPFLKHWILGIYFFWGLFAFVLIWNGILFIRDFRSWENRFIRTSYFMKFRLLPTEGKTVQEQLLNKISDVFIRYTEKWENYPKNILLDNFTNVVIKGKHEQHFFDIFIGDFIIEKKDKTSLKIKSDLKDKGYIAARILDKEEPVSSTDLSKFREEIIDVIKLPFYRKKSNPFRMIIISKSSFTDDALEYVKDSKNWINKKSFDLVEQKDDMYNVIWIS